MIEELRGKYEEDNYQQPSQVGLHYSTIKSFARKPYVTKDPR